jgi:hypothetical protein
MKNRNKNKRSINIYYTFIHCIIANPPLYPFLYTPWSALYTQGPLHSSGYRPTRPQSYGNTVTVHSHDCVASYTTKPDHPPSPITHHLATSQSTPLYLLLRSSSSYSLFSSSSHFTPSNTLYDLPLLPLQHRPASRPGLPVQPR